MNRFLSITLMVVIISIPLSAFAEKGDISVGDVGVSNLKWGEQNINVELENKTELLKFIVTNIDVSFEGVYENPEFRSKTVYILEPFQSITISPKIFIPGNYGTATLQLDLYDVIDTLDQLMPWHKFYEQPFIIKFRPSDEILPYLQEKMTFPPRVDVHPFFNNEFVRLLLTLLNEGKTVNEIADLNNCDTTFVMSQIKMLLAHKYLAVRNDSYKIQFPIITRKEAEDGKKIADVVSDKLAALLKQNISGYHAVLDSLVAAKAIPKDSNDFISGATLLYKPTPIISTFVLWFELGKDFITRSAPLLIYDGTDICNANIFQYMYMVDGGKFLNGSQFFGLFYSADAFSLMFSEKPLLINCKDNFQNMPPQRVGIWTYNRKNLPEYYIADTADIRPLISVMTKGSEGILKEAYDGLKKNSFAHGHNKVYIGHRYWMWNLIATLTLDKLFKNGTLSRHEKTFYQFDKLTGR